MRNRRGFTLIELIAVIVILAILAAVALPKYFDYSIEAAKSADEGSIAGINTALKMAYLDHQLNNAPAGDHITDINDIDTVMESGQLPEGITINGTQLEDQRENLYNFTAEAADAPARVAISGGGGGGGSPSIIAILIASYLARRRRKSESTNALTSPST